jgi:hypothetical protein
MAIPFLINSKEERSVTQSEWYLQLKPQVLVYAVKYYASMQRFHKWFVCCFQGCGRLKTPFEHATTVCSKYRERVRRLSGFGMQISPVARKIRPFISGLFHNAVST